MNTFTMNQLPGRPKDVGRYARRLDVTQHIPSVVLGVICLHLRFDHAQSTLLSVLLASRNSYEIATPHLYRDLHISSTASIACLLRGLDPNTDWDESQSPVQSEPEDVLFRSHTRPGPLSENAILLTNDKLGEAAGECPESYSDEERMLLRRSRREKCLKKLGAGKVDIHMLARRKANLSLKRRYHCRSPLIPSTILMNLLTSGKRHSWHE